MFLSVLGKKFLHVITHTSWSRGYDSHLISSFFQIAPGPTAFHLLFCLPTLLMKLHSSLTPPPTTILQTLQQEKASRCAYAEEHVPWVWRTRNHCIFSSFLDYVYASLFQLVTPPPTSGNIEAIKNVHFLTNKFICIPTHISLSTSHETIIFCP